MIPTDEELLQNVYNAQKRIQSTILTTPLLHCDWLSSETSINVFLKLESEQKTGSFKLRGACNKILKLNENDPERFLKESIVTASSGNHGLACGYVVGELGLKLSVFTYMKVAPTKERKISELKNVTLTKVGDDCCEAEVFARNYAQENNLYFISPYNDIDVIYGQGTIGLELLSQYQNLDAVIVPVGGGGLMSGIALTMKLLKPSIKIIACQPKNDCCMYECIKAGHIVEDNEMSETFADGTAGRVEPGSITFDLCNRFVDEWVLVDEEEIEKAVLNMFHDGKKLIEGAAGLTIAALRKLDKSYCSKNVALIICGGNIGIERIQYLLQKHME